MASNCSLIYSSAPAFSAGALCFLGLCVLAAGRRHAIWGDRGRRNLLNTCQIRCYKTERLVNSLPLLDLHGTGATLWQRFERRPSPSGYGQGKRKGPDTRLLLAKCLRYSHANRWRQRDQVTHWLWRSTCFARRPAWKPSG